MCSEYLLPWTVSSASGSVDTDSCLATCGSPRRTVHSESRWWTLHWVPCCSVSAQTRLCGASQVVGRWHHHRDHHSFSGRQDSVSTIRLWTPCKRLKHSDYVWRRMHGLFHSYEIYFFRLNNWLFFLLFERPKLQEWHRVHNTWNPESLLTKSSLPNTRYYNSLPMINPNLCAPFITVNRQPKC